MRPPIRWSRVSLCGSKRGAGGGQERRTIRSRLQRRTRPPNSSAMSSGWGCDRARPGRWRAAFRVLGADGSGARYGHGRSTGHSPGKACAGPLYLEAAGIGLLWRWLGSRRFGSFERQSTIRSGERQRMRPYASPASSGRLGFVFSGPGSPFGGVTGAFGRRSRRAGQPLILRQRREAPPASAARPADVVKKGASPVRGTQLRTALAGNRRSRHANVGSDRASSASAEWRQSELVGRELQHLARGKGGDGSEAVAF